MDQTSRESTRSPFPFKEARNLQLNGSASVGELKEFLATLKGRSPQQVIGIVSSSLLVQSFILAVIGVIAFMAVFTVIPYMVYGGPKAKQLATKPNVNTPAANDGVSNSANGTQSAEAATATAEKGPRTNAEKAAQAMGLDEAKSADPNANPLDKPNLDKLLDGIDE